MTSSEWSCPRCGATNQEWRNYCRGCPTTRAEAVEAATAAAGGATEGGDANPFARASEAVASGAAPPPDRVPRWVPVAIVMAIAAAGVAGYAVLRPSNKARASTVPADALPVVSGASVDSQSSSTSRTAGSVLLTPDDLPAGWVSRATAITGVDPAACGFDPGDTQHITGNAVRVFAPSDGSPLMVVSLGAVTVSSDFARSVVDQVMDGTAEGCVRDSLAGTSGTDSGVATNVSTTSSPVRDGASVLATYTLTVRGTTRQMSEELVAFAVDNRFTVLGLVSAGAPFPEHLRNQLLTSAQARLT